MISVALDGHALVRDAFRSLLQEIGGFAMVGETNGEHDLLDLVAKHRPNVVLMLDDSEDQEGGVLHRLPGVAQQAAVVVVTGVEDATLHERAIDLGARGLVLTQQSAQVLAAALRTVCAGEVWLNRAGPGAAPRRMTPRRLADDPELFKVNSLTPREREIVALITEGFTNAHVAERLCISAATARNHLTSILDKLDLDDRFQLTVYAFRRGLVRCPPAPARRRLAVAAARRGDLRSAPASPGAPSSSRGRAAWMV
jgi:DNA-binding NarL/FixJ family response regulator